eukprot:7101182-Karenia_brevis.AAC.1
MTLDTSGSNEYTMAQVITQCGQGSRSAEVAMPTMWSQNNLVSHAYCGGSGLHWQAKPKPK